MKVTNIQTDRLCNGIDYAYAEHHVEKIKLNSAAFHSYPLTTLHFPKFNDTVYNSVACKKPCGVIITRTFMGVSMSVVSQVFSVVAPL